MTLNEIKNAFNRVSLMHKDIEEFYHGTSYDIAVSNKTKYPIVFLETPYNLAYGNDRKFNQVSFAMLILIKVGQDSVEDNHNAASEALRIGSAIVNKIQDDYKSQGLFLTNVNGITLPPAFSDDYLGGIRLEITANIINQYSLPRCYEDQFDAECTDC